MYAHQRVAGVDALPLLHIECHDTPRQLAGDAHFRGVALPLHRVVLRLDEQETCYCHSCKQQQHQNYAHRQSPRAGFHLALASLGDNVSVCLGSCFVLEHYVLLVVLVCIHRISKSTIFV